MKYNKKQHTKLSCRSKCFFLALALAMASVDATAQKISLGSCITRDGGQFKGEMVSGKPQGKGTTIYKNGDTYEGSYMKGKRETRGLHICCCSGNSRYPYHAADPASTVPHTFHRR